MDNRRPGKLALTLTLGPIVAMTIAANIANAFFPALVKHHPLVLIAFDSRARNLILVTANVGIYAWFSVAIVRRVFFHPLYFLLGRWYGDGAVRWLGRRSPDIGALVGVIERWFPRFGPIIVAIYAHPLVCVLAGASRMRLLWFMVYNMVGNIIELIIIWQVGDIAHAPVKAVTDFIGRYTIPLTIVTFLIVAFYIFRTESKGESTIESISQMEEELEAESHRDGNSQESGDPQN